MESPQKKICCRISTCDRQELEPKVEHSSDAPRHITKRVAKKYISLGNVLQTALLIVNGTPSNTGTMFSYPYRILLGLVPHRS